MFSGPVKIVIRSPCSFAYVRPPVRRAMRLRFSSPRRSTFTYGLTLNKQSTQFPVFHVSVSVMAAVHAGQLDQVVLERVDDEFQPA